MLDRYRMPPSGSAGKNLTSWQPSSRAASRSEGSHAGGERQAGGLGRLDHANVQPRRNAEGRAGVDHLLDLFGREDRADAGQHPGRLAANHPERADRRRGPQRQFHHVDSAGQERLGNGRGVLDFVDHEDGDHAAGLDPIANL